MRWVILAFMVWLMDLWLLVVIGMHIGFWPVLALWLAGAATGVLLARYEGLRLLSAARNAMREGRVPDEGLIDGLVVLFGGILLIAPGALTDFAGLVLLAAPVRRRIAAIVREQIQRRLQTGSIQLMSLGTPLDAPANPWMRDDDAGSESLREVITTDGVEVQTARLLGTGDSSDKSQ